MNRTPPAGNKNIIKKTAAAVLVLTLIAVGLLSKQLIINKVHHIHDHNGAGGGCTACAQILSTVNRLKQIGEGPVGLLVIGICRFFMIDRLNIFRFQNESRTPVILKTRMNN